MAGAGRRQTLAKLLGVTSLGLGAVQLLAPVAVNRLVGVRATPLSVAVMRAVGGQELAAGASLLRRPGQAGPRWARVAGDVIHLSLLGVAARDRRNDPARIATTAGGIAAVAVLDLVAARSGAKPEPRHARAVITINRPPAEVYGYWRDLTNLPRFLHHLQAVEVIDETRSRWAARGPAGRRVEWEAEIVDERPGRLIAWQSAPGADVGNRGSVHFASAPAGAGTEVTVEILYEPPGGRLGAAVAGLLGEHPRQQLTDDLRRFKQLLETGEVARSDSSPEGTVTGRQLWRRPAQPVG